MTFWPLILSLVISSCQSHPMQMKAIKAKMKTDPRVSLASEDLSELEIQRGLKKIMSDRMARFFMMDNMNAGSASAGNLLDLGLDSDAILTVRPPFLFILCQSEDVTCYG